jgi:hypothetical protein
MNAARRECRNRAKHRLVRLRNGEVAAGLEGG